MPILKHISALAVGLAVVFVLTGCTWIEELFKGKPDTDGLKTTAGPKEDIAVCVKILDDSEFWPWTKAELYLKVHDKNNPENFLFRPLNVGGLASGSRTHQFRTPFIYDPDHPTVLCFELLDDDSMSAEQEKLLVDATKKGCQIICTAAGIYAVTQGNEAAGKVLIASGEPVGDLAAMGVSALALNLKEIKFDSMGSKEYTLFHKSDVLKSNPITIVDDDNTARCEIEVIFIPKRNNEENKKQSK